MDVFIKAGSWKGPLRKNNEDMASIAGIMLRDAVKSLDTDTNDCVPLYLFVADGMGGHQNGEQASLFLQEHLRYCFTMGDIREESFEEDITREIGYVAAKLNARAVCEGQTRAMGTTLAGVVFCREHIYLVGVGDSRVYIYRDGFLTQFSTDHEDIDGLLTNCIGAEIKPFVDVIDITSKVADDDMIVICSDGLTDMVPDDEMEYILASSANPLEDLYERACINGGEDNISIILAKVSSGFSCDGPDDDGRYDAYV